MMESTSTHPCHRLSIPAAKLFWCRHCMQIFEDPITRWRHSKTCLQSSSGKVRKDRDGSTMQVFLAANDLSVLRREQNRTQMINQTIRLGQSPGTDLRCFICKTTFVSIDEMRAHVRTPCRKRETLAVPKHKFSALPVEVKPQIQIPNTASEIIYIRDGHQTVISLESSYTAEIIAPVPDDQISAVETVFPVASKSEEVIKQPKNWNENKENNVRKRKRILFPKEVDDWQNRKTSNSPKSDPQVTLSSSPLKSDDPKDVLNDFEAPPIKISKIINKDPEDETTQVKFRAKPLQTKEEFSQLLTAEKKDNQVFLEEEPLSNGVVTELVTDEVVLFEDPDSPAEKIVTGAAAEARLKDLFSTIDIQNKAKLSSPTKQAKTINSSPKSPCKTSSSPNIRKDEINNYRNNDVEKDEKQLSLSKEEEVDTSGFLLYMPPINAGSVTLPDPLLDLRSGLPAEMLLDETTNTKPPIPNVPEAINHFDASDIMEETRLPSHIFDGDLLPSHNHSEVLFEEIMDEKENSPLDESKLAEGLVSDEINFEEAVNIESPVGVNEVEEEREKMIPAREVLSVEEVVSTEVIAPIKENSQIFASLEEISLSDTVDHVEEIAHTPIVTPIKEISVSIKETIENTIPVETVTSVLEKTIETLQSVKETTAVETMPEESVPLVKETTIAETVPPILEPIPTEAVLPILEPIPTEAVLPILEPIPTEAVLPILEPIPTEAIPPVLKPIHIDAVALQEPPEFAVAALEHATSKVAAAALEPMLPEVAMAPLEPASTEAATVALEPVPNEVANSSSETTPSEVATASLESIPSEDMIVAMEPETPEAAIAATELETLEVATAAMEPETPEVVTAAMEPETPEVATATMEPETPEVATATMEPETPEVATATMEPETPEVVTATMEPEIPEVATVSLEPIPSEAMTAAMEPKTLEATTAAMEPKTPEAATAAIEPKTQEVTTTTMQPETLEAVTAALEPKTLEAMAAALEITPVKDTAIKEIKPGEVTPSTNAIRGTPEILEQSESDQIENKESLEMSNQTAELISAEKNSEMNNKEAEKEEAEKTEAKAKHKSAKLFKCKACSNTFKTSQALQKHSRVPCKVKHTRSLSQKILRPKQPCIKIEKKPIKKKMVKPQRRPKFMVPIIPITRSELIRPTVPRRPKRFSRRKRKKSFFIDEQNRILPFVNVLMSELSDKDRFFYKLGMINQCRKIPASSEMTTVPNGEIAAVETLGDSLEQCSSKIDAKTDPTYLSEIASLSPAKVVAAEPQGIAFSASPAVAAACVSDKENPSALAKGLCLSLPTLEKMEDDQFHDPNCISPIHVKAEPHDPTGQSVQSPCWEAAPRLAQLPGVMQIVRVTSAKSLNEIDTTDKPSVTPESDQSNILANGKNLSSSNSSPQSKKMSKETVNDSNSNIGCQLGAKTLALKCEKKKVMNLKEAFENVVEDSASLPKKVSATLPEKSIKEQSCSDVVQKDKTNLSEKKIERKSDNKLKIQTKTKAESKKQLKKSKMVSLDNTDQCHRHKNSAKSKHNHSCTTKHDVIKPVNQSKIHSRNNNNNRNAKATDSCNGANIEKGKKMPHSVVGSDSSNSQKRISSTLSKNVKTLSSKKVTPDRKVSCKRATSKQETPLATTSLCKKVASKLETPLATTSLCKKVASKQETPLATTSLCKKVALKQETPLATTSLCKKVAINQEAHLPNLLFKQCSVSLRKQVRTQQVTQKKEELKLRSLKVDISNESDLSNHQNKISSTSTISTRSSPVRKSACNRSLESVSNQKNTSSLIKKQKKRTKCQNQDKGIAKPVSKSLQMKQRKSSHIFNTSLQNFKNVTSKKKSNGQNCQAVPSKYHSIDSLSLSSKKISNLSVESSLQTVTKHGKERNKCDPLSKKAAISNLSRVTRRTRNFLNSQVDCKDIPKAVTALKTNEKSLSAIKGSNSHHKNKSKVSQGASQTIKDHLNHGKRNSLSEKISGKPEVSEYQLEISQAVPTSETKHRKSKTLGGRYTPKKQQSLGSPSIDCSNTSSIPYLRTRSISKNDSAPLISESVANSTYSMSSRSKSKLCSESISHTAFQNKQSVSDKNISSSPTYHNTKSNLPMTNISRYLSKSVGKQCNKMNTISDCMKELPKKPTLKNKKLKDEIKPSSISEECHTKNLPVLGESCSENSLVSSECHSEQPVTELQSEKLLQNSEATAVTTVTTSAVTLTSSHSSNDGLVTNSDPVEGKTPVQNSETTFTLSSVATLNPRVSIATQTDSSFLKETKAENISSGSCDNVEKKEPPLSSVSLNPDPSPPLPSSPITNTTPVPVDDIPFSVALSEEERSENVAPKDIRLDTSALPLPPEIVINDNPLPSISPSLGTTSELVQVTRELQEDTETSILQQESVSIPSSADTEPAGQQLVLDNMTDPNVLVQYLSNFDPSLLSQDVTFVIIQGTPDEPVSLPNDHNFIIEQTAISEPTERESANSSLIYTLQPQLDITTEAEVVITDSS